MQNLSPHKIFYGILAIIAILLLLHIGTYLNLLKNDLGPESYFFKKLNFDSEKNVPTIFSGILHFTASIFLAFIAFSRLTIKNSRWFWASLSFVFLFLGLDEILSIHEKITGNNDSIEEKGAFFYNWILIYGAGVVVLGFTFLKPLLSLPKKTVLMFISAGIIFILGAIVLETIAGNIIFQRQIPPGAEKTEPIIFILSTFEELLEMLGVSLFIYALADFIVKYREKENVKEERKQLIK